MQNHHLPLDANATIWFSVVNTVFYFCLSSSLISYFSLLISRGLWSSNGHFSPNLIILASIACTIICSKQANKMLHSPPRILTSKHHQAAPQHTSPAEGKMISSRGIPIVQDEELIRQDIEYYQQIIQADHVDLAFCNRLVDGMRRRQQGYLHQQKPSTVFQNQAVIDHIIDTRRSGVENSTSTQATIATSANIPDCLDGSYRCYQHVMMVDREDEQEVRGSREDDLIFDMDL